MDKGAALGPGTMILQTMLHTIFISSLLDNTLIFDPPLKARELWALQWPPFMLGKAREGERVRESRGSNPCTIALAKEKERERESERASERASERQIDREKDR